MPPIATAPPRVHIKPNATISLTSWNARSAKNKLSFIQSFILSKSTDILCLTETWLTPDVTNNEILPNNYSIFRRDRKSLGGGVLIAVANTLSSTLICSSLDLELIAVEITAIPKPITLINAYIPPNSPLSLIASFTQQICQLTKTNNTVILTGDLNHPQIDWLSLSGNSPSGQLICDCFFQSNLVQLIHDPTHIGGNILDVVAIQNPNLVSNLTINPPPVTIKSDHHIINFTLEAPIHLQPTPKRTIWLYRKLNPRNILSYLQVISIPPLYSDVNTSWQALLTFLLHLRDLFVPSLTTTRNSSPVWFTPTIRHKLNCIHTLKRRSKKHPSPSLNAKLLQEESFLQELMQQAKLAYETNLVSSGNRKKIYSYLRRLSSAHASIPSIIYAPNSPIPIQSSLDTAEAFNTFFHSTFTTSDYQLPSFDQLPAPSSHLDSISIDSADVHQALLTLDPSKAFGCDDISPCLLRLCADSLVAPLTSLFQHCINSSSLPPQWKIHKITPIHKKGNRSLVSNYRPISLLSTVSILLESIIYRKIISFIRPLLSRHQFGFLSNRSCLTNLLATYSDIIKSIDEGHTIDAIYLDFAKAFDTLSHNILLFKLWHIGITGNLWLWFKSYLTDRQHFVQVHDSSSSLLPVISGVPQGSVLGPLLFLIYINDLPCSTSFSHVSLFADDTKLTMDVTSLSELELQSDLSALAEWCTTWKLRLNLDKCLSIRFTTKPTSPPTYQLHNHNLASSDTTRDLGITITTQLSFEKHYKSISSKAYYTLYLIRRTLPSHSCPISMKKQLYLTLVRSKITYCSQLWRPRLIKHIIMLENIQRRATKYITHDFTSDYKSRLHKLDLLPLMYWYELQDVLFLIKCFQSEPDNLNIYDHIKFVKSTTRRSHGMLQYTHTRTSLARHSYFIRVVKLWNALQPLNMKLPFTTLKHQVINLLWSHFTTHFDPNNPCSFHFLCPCSHCHQILPP